MRKFFKRLFVGVSVATLSLQFSCAPTPEPRLKIGDAYAVNGQYYHPSIQADYREVGYASWYGAAFHKKRTANGEVFDKNEYTAAHKTLPLPSVVKVTNLDNGRSIRVRVNDRGPFVRGRIIDMSENAASALGFKGRGTAKVLVELDRNASLALLKDPRLRMKEATKKQILEAYQRYDMPSSKNSLANLISSRRQETAQQNQLVQPVQLQEEVIQPVQLQESEQQLQQMAQAQPQQLQQKLSQTPKSLRMPIRKPVMQQVQMNLQPLNQQQTMEKVQPMLPQMGRPQKIAENKTAEQPALPEKKIAIQVAATTSKTDAERIKGKLKNFTSNIHEASVKGKKYYRVQLAESGSEADANILLNKVKSIGFKDAYIVKNSK